MIDLNYFRRVLKEKGLKVTNQRVLILGVLAGRSDKHLTAEEIYELVKAEYPEIGLATVYRTIQLLLELNLIYRINMDDGFVRYEIGHRTGTVNQHHHHLICLKCGELISFEDDLLDHMKERLASSYGFEVVDHEVKLYGYCKKCSAKK